MKVSSCQKYRIDPAQITLKCTMYAWSTGWVRSNIARAQHEGQTAACSFGTCVIPYPTTRAEGMLSWMFSHLIFIESPITVKSFLTCYCERGPSWFSRSPWTSLRWSSRSAAITAEKIVRVAPKPGLFSSMFFLNDSVSSKCRFHLKQWCQNNK